MATKFVQPPPVGCSVPQPVGFYCSRAFEHTGPCACHPTGLGGNGTPTVELTGGAVGYYLVNITHPHQAEEPYTAECGDIIEALEMTFNEGCEFKALWRGAAARTLNKYKDGLTPQYDLEKRVFYSARSLALSKPYPISKPYTPPMMRGVGNSPLKVFNHIVAPNGLTLSAEDVEQAFVVHHPGNTPYLDKQKVVEFTMSVIGSLVELGFLNKAGE